MNKLRVGVVGLSRGSSLVSTAAHHPQAEIAALCDLDPTTLADQARDYHVPDGGLFTKFHDFVNAPLDIIVIATPIELHAQQSIMAMEAGKHVLCEQTAAYTVDDCERLIQTVKRTGRVYMMAENYCYFHYIQEWQQIIAAGRLGPIVYAEGEYIHEIKRLLVDPLTR